MPLPLELHGLRWQREDFEEYLFVHATYVQLNRQSQYMSLVFSRPEVLLYYRLIAALC